MTIRKSDSEISYVLSKMGYSFLNQYMKNNTKRVVIQDHNKYKYDIGLASFIFNNSKLSIVSTYNPFSLDNISTWLRKNNKTFELCEGNTYTGNTCKLKFYCYNCKEYFYSTWNMIEQGSGCGVCNGKQVPESKSFAYIKPELTKEWSDENILLANEVTPNSSKIVYWVCSKCLYKYRARVVDRLKGVGCPRCAGKVPTDMYNLASIFPKLINEWDYEKNKMPPESYLPHSTKRVFWICPICDFHYETSICTRTRGGNCPACAGKVVTSQNNLAVIFPEIVVEWNYERNLCNPEEFSPYSGKRAWWKCKNCGFEWNSIISSRTGSKRGCPKCSSSKGENEILRVFKSFNWIENKDFYKEFVFNECRNKNLLPFDFYLPHYNLCIEYHGEQHYQPIEFFGGKKKFDERIKRDKIKEEYCYNNGINLLIIPYWDYDNIEKILEKTLQELERS